MAEQQKGSGPGKVAPFTQAPGGKGHNWPKPGDPNTKGWSEKVRKSAPEPKK